MTIAASGGVVWKSRAMTWSSGSMTRASACTMKAASPMMRSDARSRPAGTVWVIVSIEERRDGCCVDRRFAGDDDVPPPEVRGDQMIELARVGRRLALAFDRQAIGRAR